MENTLIIVLYQGSLAVFDLTSIGNLELAKSKDDLLPRLGHRQGIPIPYRPPGWAAYQYPKL
jgi:hypothetical protein